jgi:FkbM family methyltransferase
MKILNKRRCLRDFIPPVLVGTINKIRSFLKLDPKKNIVAPIQPFISPVLGSYSQFNEDLLIDILLGYLNKGFYLDIGANDPSFNSNTKRFYDRGWCGVNIEPGVESFNKFRLSRIRDINLNIGAGPVKGTLTFYQVVGDSTLSSFNKEIANKMATRYGLSIKEATVDVLRLVDIFEHYVKDSKVDFMSVDAEGLDLGILQSNDWDRFRPSLLMAEIDNQYHEIVGFMNRCNYFLIYNNYHNGIFIDRLTTENSLLPIVSNGNLIEQNCV